MFKPIYMHSFACNSDIIREFEIPEDSLEGCEVLLAYYHCGDYGCDSSAFVLFRKDGKLYEVNGSHCSCHGLESMDYYSDGGTQWEPEEVTLEELEHRLEKGCLGDVGGYDDIGYKDECVQVVNYLKGIENEHVG